VLLLGEFIVYACVATHLDRLDEPTAQGILVVVGSAAVVLWSCLVHSVSMTALYVNVLPLMLITLGYALLGQGLVLLVLAVPIQFDKANIPLAWSIQGVVVMFLAHRLGSLPLLIMAPTVLAPAVALILVAAAFWAGRAGLELPVNGDTWGWLVLSAGLAAPVSPAAPAGEADRQDC